MSECPACAETNPERARFCLACGHPLAETPDQGAELRRSVSIIFADLAGSTVLGESLDAEALRYVTGRYFDTMRAAVERHGGAVEKFIGDAVVAVFGVPRVREDDALRAVRAATDMRTSLTALNDELHRDLGVRLEVRIGVNTGEVVVGERRAGGSLATGDAVNVAARLEQAAGPGEVLIGDATHRLVRDHVTAEPVDALALKGKAEPVVAWRLIDVAAPTTDTPDRPADTTFVGRDSQLRLLEDGFRRVQGEGTCQLVTVLGVAGMGKSRLAEEFIAGRTDALVMQGRCLSYGQGATYWPLREAVLTAAGLTGDETVDVVESALTAALGTTPDTANVVTRLVALAGFRREETVPEDMPWAVRTFLETLARHRPVVLVIDDLHWAEPGLLDVVEHVADWSRDAPIMLLGLARPEFYDARPTWGGGKLNATALLLSALDDAATDSLLEKHDIPAEVKQRIIDAAGGNPLFVEQLVAMLVDEGHAEMHDGVATWADESAVGLTLTMPPTVAALLAARIDRLDDDERTVLGCAAVVGPVFYVDAVSVIIDRPVDDVRRLLGQLVRKELLRPAASDLPGMAAYKFLHGLVRDAAYDGLAKASRAQWHERLADWYAALDGDVVPDEIVGHHLASACDYRRQLGPATDHTRDLAKRAAARLAAAGHRFELSDVAAAASLFQRAVDLLEPGDPDRVESLLGLASDRMELGEIEAAQVALREATQSGDPRQALLAAVLQCQGNSFTPEHRVEDSEEVLRQAIRQFTSWGDDGGLALTYLVSADVANLAGHLGRSAEMLALALAHAEAAGDAMTIARTRSLLGVFYLFGSMPAEDVIAALDQMLTASGNDPRVRAETEQIACVMHGMCGRLEQARALGAAARTHLAEVGHGLFLANLAQSTGHVEELAGDLDAAEREYERSTADLDAMGESAYLSTVAGLHARLLARQGKVAAAEAALAVARKHGSIDDVATQSLVKQTEAMLAAIAGDAERCRARIVEAVELEGDFESPDAAGEVHLLAADALRALGDSAGEREHLAAALPFFTGKGNVVRAELCTARLKA